MGENTIVSEDQPRVADHTNGRNGEPPGGPQRSRLSRLGREEHDWSAGLLFVLAVYAASRLFYLISGSLLARVVPVGEFYRITPDVPFGTLNIWSHWDGAWYTEIAGEGYGASAPASTAFFPLYPLLLRSFAELFGGPLSQQALSVWGPLISLVFLPFAFYFIYHIARNDWGERVAQGSVLALAFFPTTFFLNAAYTESLFLALSAGSLWAARVRRDLLLACVLGGFAAATRNVGIFLVAPLVYEWIKEGGLEEGSERWQGVYLALIPSGLLAYMGYLWVRFGDPLLFYSAQKNWGRQATGPLDTAGRAWRSALEGAGRLLDPALWAHPTLENVADHLAGAVNLFNLSFFVFAV